VPRNEGAMSAGSMEAWHLGRRRLDARHLPFFAALGTLDTSSPEWMAAKAGLVTLRLLDDWVAQGRCVLAIGNRARRAVVAAISELSPTGSDRQFLANIVDATVRAPEPAIVRVAAPLLAYGYALQVRAAWALAADVYKTVFAGCGAEDTDPIHGDPRGAAIAALGMASCYRQLGDSDRAAEAYASAERIGVQCGDVYTALKARIRQGRLVIERGNFPAAEAMLEELTSASTAAGFPDLRAEVLHQRAHVAYGRGEYCRAAVYASEAWMDTTDPVERDYILVGLASCLQEMGQAEAARDVNSLLASQARDTAARWSAMLNLIELATLDRREVEFQRYRTALEAVELPPRLACHFFLYTGRGYDVFGWPDRARAALQQAVSLGEVHGFHELVYRAESALSSLGKSDVPATAADTSRRARTDLVASPEMAAVAATMRTVRELSAVVA